VSLGDALVRLRDLPSESIHCCVTSPPYYGLQSYGSEVRRVLRKDGTLWLNIGDSATQAHQKGQAATARKAV
jgi:DNA modification methylase